MFVELFKYSSISYFYHIHKHIYKASIQNLLYIHAGLMVFYIHINICFCFIFFLLPKLTIHGLWCSSLVPISVSAGQAKQISSFKNCVHYLLSNFHFFTKWQSFKNYEKCFLFHLKSSLCSQVTFFVFSPSFPLFADSKRTNGSGIIYDVMNWLA